LSYMIRDLNMLTKNLKEKPIFDGEVCIVDGLGVEDFSAVMKEWSKKNHTIKNPKYKIFDCLSNQEFSDKKSTRILSERFTELKNLFMTNLDVYDTLEILPQIKVDSEETYIKFLKKMEEINAEGAMLRKDTIYLGKRTDDLIKIKTFLDAEYTIIDVETGPVSYNEDGQKTYQEALSSVTIEHKGNRVSVGSGFTKNERINLYYGENSKLLIGQVITVKYFEESTDKNGNLSLRFPTIKTIHGKVREV